MYMYVYTCILSLYVYIHYAHRTPLWAALDDRLGRRLERGLQKPEVDQDLGVEVIEPYISITHILCIYKCITNRICIQ